MPSVKGKGNGGKRQGAGRKSQSLRTLTARPKELQFSEPVIAHADVYSLGWCLHCGAAWWEGFPITYRQGKPNEVEDEQGNFFSVVGEEWRPGQLEQHYKKCPLYKSESSRRRPQGTGENDVYKEYLDEQRVHQSGDQDFGRIQG